MKRLALAFTVGALALAAPAAATRPPWEAGELVRLQTRQRVVALTFDAGGSDAGGRSILATLARDRVRATFFLTGHFVDSYPVLARTIGARFVVGNHTQTHPRLPRLPDAAVRREILGGQQRILAVTRHDPRPLFRFPYGDRDARTIRISRQLGYVPIRWTVDSLGWKGASRTAIVSQVVGSLEPGAIVLMHVDASDAAALPAVVAALRARTYRFVTLASVNSAAQGH